MTSLHRSDSAHNLPGAVLLNSQFSSPSPASRLSSLPQPHLPPSPPPRPRSSRTSSGLLTPSSSKASLSPALSRYKDRQQPPSPPAPPPDLPRKSDRTPHNRHLFFPVRASLELFAQPPHCAATTAFMPEVAVSRPHSPVRRSRATSPKRPDRRTRAPSRCESLLRDTLRRDEHERSLVHRTMSRSPTRVTRGRSRPRDNSFLEALKRDVSSDCDCDADDLAYRMNGSDAFGSRKRTQAMSVRGHGGVLSSNSSDAGSVMYGSPSSPSPMPPSMMRTRTAPSVPRVKGLSYDNEQRVTSPHPPNSPRNGRRSLPNTGFQSHGSMAPSNEASPKQRMGTLSPHESVLRQKLEYVLQKAEEPTSPSRRNHQRAYSHGVTVTTSKNRDGSSPESSSPQSLAPSSLSNSATDLARSNSTPSNRRRDSLAYRTSPSSPPEPLTPPPTPPFNARTAAEACKRIPGYVSFASVEGLGEPPGLDMDSDDSDEGIRKLGRWLRKLRFLNGHQGATELEGGQTVVGRNRSGSTSGSR